MRLADVVPVWNIRSAAAGIALLAGLSLFLYWPGIATFDSVVQYEQVLSGHYDDWHPPAMARLWSLLAWIAPGTGLMFLLQMGLYWFGLGLLAAALTPRRAGWAVLLLGCSPLFLGWMTAVLKDGQMLGALLAATALVAESRLAGRPVGKGRVALAATLLAYALLVRANALFATVPLLLGLTGWLGQRSIVGRAGLALAVMVTILVVSPVVNHRLLGAHSSGVERTLPLYDLAGIAHFARLPTMAGVSPALWKEAESRRCYTPFYWDSYGDDDRCGFISDALGLDEGAQAEPIMKTWGSMIAAHPFAYLRHRLAHWNANMRFLVGSDEPNAVAPALPEGNRLGLSGAPASRTELLARLGQLVAASPLGWPACWFALALATLWTTAAMEVSPQRDLAVTLALSACASFLSYAIVSIASDLRYHLWGMVAAGLGAILLTGCKGLPRGRMVQGGAGVLAVSLVAILARLAGPFVI